MRDATDDALHPFEAEKRQRAFILRVVRWIFFAAIIGFALLTILREPSIANTGQSTVDFAIQWWIPVGVAICMFLIAYLVDHYTPNKKISTISGVFMGILVGMLAAVALGFVMDLLVKTWVEERMVEYFQPLVMTLKIMLGICLSYLGVTTVLQTQDEFRLVIPYVEFAKQIRGVRPILLDTSALIDARIADVAATGLIQATLIVPRFVLGELQLLADSSDRLKRARGRRGLDVVTRLQRQGTIDVKIDDTPVTAMAVDQQLVELAEKLGGARLLTTDLALARVGQIHGVVVLNLHEIANALRPSLISGQQLVLRLVKPGEQPGQAVGYLDDGTMVVAENAVHRIGLETLLLVTGSLQTTAGRLVFARPVEAGEIVEGELVDAAPDDMPDALRDERAFEDMLPPTAEATPARRPNGPVPPPATPKGGVPPFRRPGSARNPRR